MNTYRINSIRQNNYQFNPTQNVAFCAKKMPTEVSKTLMKKFSAGQSFDIYLHSSPDEDAINSAKLIYNWLKKMGKDVYICVHEHDTKGLKFNPKKYKIKQGSKPSDIAIVLDFNGNDRVPKPFDKMLKRYSPDQLVIIDHHIKSNRALNGFSYVDLTARSCCAIIYRFFESIGYKLTSSDSRNLLCGIISDGVKSKILKLKNNRLLKTKSLDKNSHEVLEGVQKHLGPKDRMKIYTHLDIISNLNHREKIFRKRLVREIQVTPNGKLAYIVINPGDKQYAALGGDNVRTSAILADLRLRLTNGINKDELFSNQQKAKLEKIEGAIIFYPTTIGYQMSVHTKKEYAQCLIEAVRKINPGLIAGGHPNRAGAKIFSNKKEDIQAFINSFLNASEALA